MRQLCIWLKTLLNGHQTKLTKLKVDKVDVLSNDETEVDTLRKSLNLYCLLLLSQWMCFREVSGDYKEIKC